MQLPINHKHKKETPIRMSLCVLPGTRVRQSRALTDDLVVVRALDASAFPKTPRAFREPYVIEGFSSIWEDEKRTPYRMSFVSSQGLEPWTH